MGAAHAGGIIPAVGLAGHHVRVCRCRVFACDRCPLTLPAAVARRLGSRLYFEFTAAALGDGAAWEGLADSVAVEVRRHGAPAPASLRAAPAATAGPAAQVTAQDGVGEAAVAPAMVLAPTALAAAAAARGVAGAAGAGMSSVVHVDNHSNSVTNTSNSNIGNTSTNNIVLL